MTNVVVVVEHGMIQDIYCRNKNIQVEVLDFDTQDEADYIEKKERLNRIEKCKSYKEIY